MSNRRKPKAKPQHAKAGVTKDEYDDVMGALSKDEQSRAYITMQLAEIAAQAKRMEALPQDEFERLISEWAAGDNQTTPPVGWDAPSNEVIELGARIFNEPPAYAPLRVTLWRTQVVAEMKRRGMK